MKELKKFYYYTLTVKFKVRTKEQAKELRQILTKNYNDLVSKWTGVEKIWLK